MSSIHDMPDNPEASKSGDDPEIVSLIRYMQEPDCLHNLVGLIGLAAQDRLRDRDLRRIRCMMKINPDLIRAAYKRARDDLATFDSYLLGPRNQSADFNDWSNNFLRRVADHADVFLEQMIDRRIWKEKQEQRDG